MLDGKWNQSLAMAVDGVLETMFFTVSEGAPRPGLPDAADSVGARLTFRGHESGRLDIRLTPASARSLAADFLGVDLELITGGQVGEVVCELADMICGSMMSELDAENLIQLSPSILFAGPSPPPISMPVAEHAVALANGALVAIVARDEAYA